jgi:hypothetical protein
VLKTKHSDALGKADPCSRPQKIKCRILMINVSHSGNNHKGARSSSRPYISCNVSSVNEYDKAADLNVGQNSFCHVLHLFAMIGQTMGS